MSIACGLTGSLHLAERATKSGATRRMKQAQQAGSPRMSQEPSTTTSARPVTRSTSTGSRRRMEEGPAASARLIRGTAKPLLQPPFPTLPPRHLQAARSSFGPTLIPLSATIESTGARTHTSLLGKAIQLRWSRILLLLRSELRLPIPTRRCVRATTCPASTRWWESVNTARRQKSRTASASSAFRWCRVAIRRIQRRPQRPQPRLPAI